METRYDLLLCDADDTLFDFKKAEVNAFDEACATMGFAATKEFCEKGVCAVDLAGAEALFATENFEEIFSEARKLDIPFTIHAGENGNRPSDAGSSSTPEHELFIIQALVQEIHRTIPYPVFHQHEDPPC